MSDHDKAIIDSLLNLLPFFSQIFDDIAIAFSDKEKYIYYTPGKKLDHKIRPGDPVKAGSMTDKAFKHRGFLSSKVDSSVFGVPYTASGFPIFNSDNEIIGGLVFCESIEMQEKQHLLKTISKEITKNMFTLNNDMDSLKNQSEYINSTSKELLTNAQESQSQIEESNKIVNLIKNISYKTNMLSVNAAIEAARTGSEGTGFKVISDEIRELSINTDDAIKKIEGIIKEIHLNSEGITLKIDNIADSLESITSFISQTREITKQLHQSSELIDDLAENLVKSADKDKH